MRSSSRSLLVASGRVGCLRQSTCNSHVLQLRHCGRAGFRRLRPPPSRRLVTRPIGPMLPAAVDVLGTGGGSRANHGSPFSAPQG